MGTEDETDLTLQGRATAAAGAALVAACIVNPLDVIKTRIQAQAMAESSGGQARSGCSTPWTCTSTLYEHAAAQHQHGLHHTAHGLSDCHHQHQHQHQHHHTARPWLPQRHAHTLSPLESAWAELYSNSSSSTRGASASSRLAAAGATSSSASAAAAAISAARSAAADSAAAAAASLRRWGITEGPCLPIRRTPPFPVPTGWTPAPVTAAVNPAAAVAAAAASVGILPASALSAGGGAAAGAPCPCAPPPPHAHASFPFGSSSSSMWEMAKQIRAREGLPVLWRGTSASLLIAVPMVGIYMPLYDTLLDSWSSSLGSLAPVVSGTSARTAACFCVAPFELIRTRLQASVTAGVSMRSTITSLVAEPPPPAPAAAAAAPAGQQLLLQQARGGGQVAAAAATAAAANTSTQLQVHQQPAPPQIRPASVLRAVPRMWTGFSATLVRDVPFSALYWALVEPLRQAMLPINSHWPPLQQLDNMLHRQQQQQQGSSASSSSSNGSSQAAVPPSRQHLMHHSQLEILIANMVSGFVAGGLAAGATTPFDVVKTRMQIASPSQQQQQQALSGGSSGSSGSSSRLNIRVFNILGDVYRKEGVEGMFAGLKPRAARAAPACAIVISVYELLKSYLTPGAASFGLV